MDIRRSLATMLAGLMLSAACVARPESPRQAATRSVPAAKAPAGDWPRGCNDALFPFFPGYTDYCNGLREWHAGEYDDALFDIKDAASWANKNAQYTLGLIYFNGHHVAADRSLGLAWLLLAAERKQPRQFIDVAVAAYRVATPDQRKQALQWLMKLRPRYGDAYAVHRARMHLKHAMYEAVPPGDDAFGASVCIDGLTGGITATPSGDTDFMGRPTVHGLPHSMGSASTPTGTAGSCSSAMVVERMLQHASDAYFEGLTPSGHVDVGPLRQVPVPRNKDRH